MCEYPVTGAAGQRMMSYIPEYYETSRVIRVLNQVRGVEIDKLRQALDETLNQFFVRTATWSLDDWEEELNLQPEPDFTEAERQDRIVSKLRGYGTCTINLVKTVAEAYDKGSVEIVQDHTIYQVKILFVDTYGVPPNLDDLKLSVREVVPAHLGIEYEFIWLLWSTLDVQEIAWSDLDDMNMTWDEFEKWNPVLNPAVRSSVTCTFCEP